MKPLFLIMFCFSLIGCNANARTIDNSTVASVDIDRYLGSWYEIARFDHSFERGLEQTKAQYTLRPDGKIDVLNSGYKNGMYSEAHGKAKATSVPGLLRVSFFGPFYGDYRILLLDSDYRYVLVGSNKSKFLWILSRTPQLPEGAREELLLEIAKRGYDADKLIWVKQ